MPVAALFTRLRATVTRLGVRRSAWLEMGLFFTVLLGWDHFFGRGARFATASPHPFWAIVLLMSGFYGLREGLASALVAALLFRAGNVPEQRIDQQVYDYAWTVLREPMLWILAAGVLGEVRRQHARHEHEVAEELSGTRAHLDDLVEAYRRIDGIKERLETRVVGQATTAVQLYKAVQAADRLDPRGVLDTVSEVVRATLEPESFSLYLMNGESLDLVLQEGWPADGAWPRRYVSDTPLFDAVIAGRRMLCAANAPDEAVLVEQGLLAGPLVDVRTGDIVGMLKIERMRFLDFNLSSLHAFRALCEWIATAYQNAQRFEEAQADRVADQSTQLFSMTYLERQRAYLTAMAQRFEFDLTMLVLRVENIDELTREERVSVAVAISRAVRTSLRRTDMAFDYRSEAGEVAVLMPGTPLANVYVVAAKLERAIGAQLARPLRVSTRTHVIYTANSRPMEVVSPVTTTTIGTDPPGSDADQVA
jgi:GGDEF domain-containing protein